jgi:hypothetical protein
LLFLFFAQNIAHAEEPIKAHLGVNVLGSFVGRFSGDPHWPDLGDP